MTTHELQAMRAQQFFEHIGEGFECVERLKRYAQGNSKDAYYYRDFPEIQKRARHNSEIQTRAAHRLNAWLKKQITIKMLSL